MYHHTDVAVFLFFCFFPPGCIGDGNHQQISPEAVRELGFCQRQAAVQILPERSGRAAAQTVAPLEERRGGTGEDGTAGAVHLVHYQLDGLSSALVISL